MLKHEIPLALYKSLNGYHFWSKRLGISYIHEIGMYTAIMMELQIFIKVTNTFAENLNEPAHFRARTFATSTKMFLRELRAFFITI